MLRYSCAISDSEDLRKVYQGSHTTTEKYQTMTETNEKKTSHEKTGCQITRDSDFAFLLAAWLVNAAQKAQNPPRR